MSNKQLGQRRFWSSRTVGAVGAVIGLVVVLLYMSGTIGIGKVKPGVVPAPAWVAQGSEVQAEAREVVDTVDWPGTVNSRLVAHVAPKVMARVQEMRVTIGDVVRDGQVLAVLDDRDIRTRVEQARAALAAAEAEAEHAAADLRRVRALFEREATTQQERDAAEARARAAEAGQQRARQALAEVEVLLGETILKAPFAGVVAARMADPGDLATPGRPLLVLHDPASLRFEASVAEAMAGQLRPGDALAVRIDRPPMRLEGRIEEIAPRAEPTTRTLLIKLSLPPERGLLPGAYGVLEVPVASRRALLVPARAVSRRGQLEMVYVRADGQSLLRQVRTGKRYGEWVEVLSGLDAGTTVLVPR